MLPTIRHCLVELGEGVPQGQGLLAKYSRSGSIAAKAGHSSPVMEWSGRAPAPPANEAGRGRRRQGARLSQKLSSAIAVIGRLHLACQVREVEG